MSPDADNIGTTKAAGEPASGEASPGGGAPSVKGVEPTRSGMSPWPRYAVVHVAPRGQGAMPARAAQLKR